MKKTDEIALTIEKYFGKRREYLAKTEIHFTEVANLYYTTISKQLRKLYVEDISKEISETFSRRALLDNINKLLSGTKSKASAAVLFIQNYLDTWFQAKNTTHGYDFSNQISLIKSNFADYVNSFKFPIKFEYLLNFQNSGVGQTKLGSLDKDYLTIIGYLKNNLTVFKNSISACGLDVLSQLNFKAGKLIALKSCYSDNEIMKRKDVDITKIVEVLDVYKQDACDVFGNGGAEYVLAYIEALDVISSPTSTENNASHPYQRIFEDLNNNITQNLNLFFDKISELDEVDYYDYYVKTFNVDLKSVSDNIIEVLKNK